MIHTLWSMLPNLTILLVAGVVILGVALWATLEAERRDDPWPWANDAVDLTKEDADIIEFRP